MYKSWPCVIIPFVQTWVESGRNISLHNQLFHKTCLPSFFLFLLHFDTPASPFTINLHFFHSPSLIWNSRDEPSHLPASIKPKEALTHILWILTSCREKLRRNTWGEESTHLLLLPWPEDMISMTGTHDSTFSSSSNLWNWKGTRITYAIFVSLFIPILDQ